MPIKDGFRKLQFIVCISALCLVGCFHGASSTQAGTAGALSSEAGPCGTESGVHPAIRQPEVGTGTARQTAEFRGARESAKALDIDLAQAVRHYGVPDVIHESSGDLATLYPPGSKREYLFSEAERRTWFYLDPGMEVRFEGNAVIGDFPITEENYHCIATFLNLSEGGVSDAVEPEFLLPGGWRNRMHIYRMRYPPIPKAQER